MAGAELSKTRQIYLVLRDRIARGEFDLRGVLPGEQALAEAFKVSRVTLRRALAALEAEGVVDRRRGAGTFLAQIERPKPVAVELGDIMPHLLAMGRTTQARLLAFEYRPASEDVARALKLSRGARVQWSLRKRLIDGAPFSHLTTCVPEAIGRLFGKRDLAKRPLMALLEENGVVADHATQDISAVLATPEVAAALEVAVGAPLIALTRTIYAASGQGVEHLQAFYRPDRYTFRMDLQRRTDHPHLRWTASAARAQDKAGALA